MRTFAYIDGFNLFYGSLKGGPHKWLDLCAYFDRTLPAPCTLVKVKYFTARVKPLPNNPDAPKRQDVYLRALRARLGAKLDVVEGNFSIKDVWAATVADPAVKVKIIKSEEKGSDVNLAVELVNDGWLDLYDCAAVVSNDADIASAMRVAKQQLGKHVILYTPGAPKRRPMAALTKWSHRQIDVTQQDIALCQMQSPTPEGLTRPTDWDPVA